MSEMSKKKTETKKKKSKEEEMIEKLQLDIKTVVDELNKAQQLVNQLVVELNNHKALCAQYETTINALTGRLLEGRSQ
mgnify:FL=1|jgi:Mg2+ and Co2+ transporter CorA|tara:strand:- start:124 stop:357 length:234 start_codon:yes stop_codon:yes gene_type:complete